MSNDSIIVGFVWIGVIMAVLWLWIYILSTRLKALEAALKTQFEIINVAIKHVETKGYQADYALAQILGAHEARIKEQEDKLDEPPVG